VAVPANTTLYLPPNSILMPSTSGAGQQFCVVSRGTPMAAVATSSSSTSSGGLSTNMIGIIVGSLLGLLLLLTVGYFVYSAVKAKQLQSLVTSQTAKLDQDILRAPNTSTYPR
jgi:hypothetical protein